MSQPADAVLVQVENGIATITLNRPKTRNALSPEIRDGMRQAVERMRNDEAVRVVILRGNNGAFCAGGDISQMSNAQRVGATFRSNMRDLHQWFSELINLEKPVIAAVDGAAFGAGLSLALASDFVVATERARFCAVFGRIGLVPDLGAMRLLPRIVGQQKAKELAFTARTVDAKEAQQLGMVYEVVADEAALDAAVQALAQRLCEASTVAIGLAKNIMNQAYELDLGAMNELEAYAQTVCRSSDYHQDAVQRFQTKQPLRFDWDRKA